MTDFTNKYIKIIYHLYATIFLLLLAKNINSSSFIRASLVFLAIFHLYDTWWFLTYDKNAPI